MRKEERLWWAIRHPEEKVYDERVERIEGRGYRWAYWILTAILFLVHIFLSGSLGKLSADTAEDVKRFFLLAFIAEIFFIENGRFLYSCLNGVQQYHRDAGLLPGDSKSGMGPYLLNGFWCFFFARMAFYVIFKSADTIGSLLGWLLAILCVCFYWGLCHLAYWHFAKTQEDETEQQTKKRGRSVKLVCAVSLICFYLGFTGLMMWGNFTDRFGAVQQAKVSETEWDYIEELEKGIENYEKLDSKEVEHFYICERDSREGNEKYELGMELPKIPVGDIASVSKEQQGRETVYTVRYGEVYNGILERLDVKDENKLARDVTEASEQYVLNEFGILTSYAYEETGMITTSYSYEGDGKFGGTIEPKKEEEGYSIKGSLKLNSVNGQNIEGEE